MGLLCAPARTYRALDGGPRTVLYANEVIGAAAGVVAAAGWGRGRRSAALIDIRAEGPRRVPRSRPPRLEHPSLPARALQIPI
ncbi:hypothetical protein EVAR_60832_1 [Eumeta japonica]|uniref:Uncharacterized protein n=1 Tax=Eumeta variegata TaxID=151549 RepID=A0A4C1Y9R2_EUMVA|nr:hypothetical protein EVAR_60832_1 [Eumeta japonica]